MIRDRRNVILFPLLQLRTCAVLSPPLPIKPQRGGKSGLNQKLRNLHEAIVGESITLDFTPCKCRQVRRTK
jgi:hypothetical protein